MKEEIKRSTNSVISNISVNVNFYGQNKQTYIGQYNSNKYLHLLRCMISLVHHVRLALKKMTNVH